MKIPEEKIQEVREATDIVEVVSQYVTLKKRGKSFVGLCPFHTEGDTIKCRHQHRG